MKYRKYQLVGKCYKEPTYVEVPYWQTKKSAIAFILKTYNEVVEKMVFIESYYE